MDNVNHEQHRCYRDNAHKLDCNLVISVCVQSFTMLKYKNAADPHLRSHYHLDQESAPYKCCQLTMRFRILPGTKMTFRIALPSRSLHTFSTAMPAARASSWLMVFDTSTAPLILPLICELKITVAVVVERQIICSGA